MLLPVRAALTTLFHTQNSRPSQFGSHCFRPGLLSYSYPTKEGMLPPLRQQNSSKSLLLSTILRESSKYMSSCHLLNGTLHFSLGRWVYLSLGCRNWLWCSSSPLSWSDWGTEVLYSSVTPDALASQLSERPNFSLICCVGQRRTISVRCRSLL